jgi:hypothetical protein
LLNPKGGRSPLGEGVNPREACTSFTTTNIKAQDRSQNFDNGWEWARPIAMIGHSWGAHITHDARHDEAMHLDQLTTLDHGASNKQGHDLEPSPSPSTLQHGNISINIYNARAPLLKRRVARHPGPTLLVFSLSSFSLSLSHVRLAFSWSIKGKTKHPTRGDFLAPEALRLRGLRGPFFDQQEALQLHFTFIRDLGAHPSLDRL